jgi:hypothetical protein
MGIMVCVSCGVSRETTGIARMCRSCSAKARFANPENCERLSKSLKKFWGARDFISVGKNTRKSWVIEEQGGKCLHCKIDQIWNGKPLVFQLDHINGDRSNNERVNLRALCPNCHTQTETFGSRSVSDDARERIIAGAKKGNVNMRKIKSKI